MIRASLVLFPWLLGGSQQAPVVVPAQMLGNYFCVEGTVNGKKAKFVVDSGAGLSVLTPEAAKRFGVKEGQRVVANGVGEKSVQAMLTQAETMGVGGGQAKNVAIVVIDLPPVLDCDGLVGFSFLRNFAVQFDYQKPSMTLFAPGTYRPSKEAKSSEMRLKSNIPTCKGSLQGVEGWFSLDTGANGTLTVMTPFVTDNKLKEKYPKRVARIVGKGVGGFVNGEAVKLETFTLGGFSFPTTPASLSAATAGALASKDLVGNVGGEVLRRFILTIDYPGAKVHFEKSPAFADAFVVDRSGMFVDFEAGEAKVVEVVSGGPADKAGVKVGDVLISVDGKSYGSIHPLEAGKLFRAAAGTKLALSLKRGPEAVLLTLELRDLL